jgi:DNA-binding LacI/PurR family transcriptional regulator
MIERRVEGVAILSFEKEISLIEAFKNRTLPIVVLDKESREPLLKTVCIDYLHGVRQAVQHLAALGHVRIALIAENCRGAKNSLSGMHEGNWFGNASATARGGRSHARSRHEGSVSSD